MKSVPENQSMIPDEQEIFGLPVCGEIVFSNHKNVFKKKQRKRQTKLLEKITFIKTFLKEDEKIFLITTGCSHTPFLEQFLTGWTFIYLKRSLFVFTNKRIFHIPTRANYSYKSSIAQILYSDCKSIKMKGRTLVVAYKNGSKEKFLYIASNEKKKIKTLLQAISLEGTPSKIPKRIHLCPCCTKELEEGKYICPKCQLEFKNKDVAKRISIIYPGGGYFYTGHPVLGVCDAIGEILLIAFVIISFFDGSKGKLTIYAISLIIEKITTVYHSNHFIKEYIPKCNHQTRIPDECSICRYNKSGGILKYILLPLLVMGALFSAFVYTKVIDVPYHLLKGIPGFNGDQIYEVTKASPNLPVSREPRESIDINQFVELRKMLENKQYEELTTTLEGYQNAFESDHTNELKVYDAFRSFEVTLPSYEPLLKEWIKKLPERYPPYLATAQYYETRGWESRGYKWAKDTTIDQFDKMRLYFGKAEENLQTALKINPNLFIAYNILLRICNANGLEADEDCIVERALELFPYSFIIRRTYMWAKLPRWGGSYRIMEDFAKDAEKYSNIDSKLLILYGRIYEDQANVLSREDKYVDALGLLAKALSFGDYWKFYKERAAIYNFSLNERDKALEDVNRSIVLRPTRSENYLLRSKVYFEKGDLNKSINDLSTAVLLKPGDQHTLQWKVWASDNLQTVGFNLEKQDLNKAIETYDLALKFNPENGFVWNNRGAILDKLNRYEEALESYNRTINLKPGFVEAWNNIGVALANLGRYDEAIIYHDKAIELRPDFSYAWYKKGCTYFLMGDKEKCITNLQKALELEPIFKSWMAKDEDLKPLWDDEDFKKIVN